MISLGAACESHARIHAGKLRDAILLTDEEGTTHGQRFAGAKIGR